MEISEQSAAGRGAGRARRASEGVSGGFGEGAIAGRAPRGSAGARSRGGGPISRSRAHKKARRTDGDRWDDSLSLRWIVQTRRRRTRRRAAKRALENDASV